MKKTINLILFLVFILIQSCYKPNVNISDDPNMPYSTILIKQGTADVITQSDFGSIVKGNSKSIVFTIYNNGNQPLELTGASVVSLSDSTYFQVSQNPSASIPPKGSSNFEITFNPGMAYGAQRNSVVTLQNNSKNQPNYSFNVTGIATDISAPSIQVHVDGQSIDSNGTHNFGTQKSSTVGNWITFTVSNNGTAPLTINNFNYAGTQFEKDSSLLSSSINAGENSTFKVRFKPLAEGTQQESLSFSHNDSNKGSSFTLNLTGTSVLAHISVYNGAASIPSYNFGQVKSGLSSSPVSLTIKNTGGLDLNLTGNPKISITGSDSSQFLVQSDPSSPVPKNGGESNFIIIFKPTAPGSKSAQLSISHDGVETNPFTISLSGEGTLADSPKMSILIDGVNYSSGTVYDFGKKKSGTSTSAVTFTIKNTGSGDLTLIPNPSLVNKTGSNAGEFSISDPAQSVVSANGGTVTFTVVFSPASIAANKTALISISNDDSSSNPYTINLKGEGTAYDLPKLIVKGENNSTHVWSDIPENGLFDFGQISGCSMTNFKIKNIGTVSVQNISVASSDTLQFSTTIASPASLNPLEESSFVVNFCPLGASGSYTALLTVSYKDSLSNAYTYKYNVKGTK